jgi:hypothetical protein
VESFGDNLKLKLTLGFPIVNATSGLNQIEKNKMKDLTGCALHDFALNYMNNSEMEAHSLFHNNIIEYDVRLKMF